MFRKFLPLFLLVFVTACSPQSQGTPCHGKHSGMCHCMKTGECPCAKAENCGCQQGSDTCQCGENCECPMCQKHKKGANAGDHHGSVPMHQGMTCHKPKQHNATQTR